MHESEARAPVHDGRNPFTVFTPDLPQGMLRGAANSLDVGSSQLIHQLDPVRLNGWHNICTTRITFPICIDCLCLRRCTELPRNVAG